VLVVGDSKMGPQATRPHSAAKESAYLCAYRPAGATATDEIAGWIEDALPPAPAGAPPPMKMASFHTRSLYSTDAR